MRLKRWISAVSKRVSGDLGGPRGRRSVGGGLWLLLMLGIPAFIFRRIVVGRVLATGDLQTYFHPYWSEVIRSLHAGRLPLWNPYLFAGAPLLANSQVGIFYPLNWPLWGMVEATPLGAARALHVSVLLHVGLAAVNTFIVGRRLTLSTTAAALSGLLYAGSGFLGIHVAHLNQLQGLAWLPLLFLPAPRGNWMPSPISVVAWTLILLTGHTQTAFIAAVGLLLWRVGLIVSRQWSVWRRGMPQAGGQASAGKGAIESGELIAWLVGLLPLGLGVVAAMAQLALTLQLAQFSTRSGGLPWREAVSFSVAPWLLPRVLLPPYGFDPQLPEGVAYLGVSGLALGLWGFGSGIRRREWWVIGFALLTGGGLFLALGGYNPLYALAVRVGVPGLIHFRAPARFLALTVVGGALLAGWGADVLATRLKLSGWGLRAAWAALWVIGGLELVIAAERLPHADATAPASYTSLRPATAFLMAASRENEALDRPPERFLSISQMLFEVGDKSETALIYDDLLAEDALWNLWVSDKQREVLAPNLPMTFRVPAVDGYDGGLLPLRHYGAFSHLLLPDGTLDGRLRENLPDVPDTRWLSLLGVHFLLTDKTADTWVEDVFYDRQFQPQIPPGQRLEVASLPGYFDANALGLLYEGDGGRVKVTLPSGEILRELPGRSGDEGEPGVTRVRWSEPGPVVALSFSAGSSPLKLVGASLVDERTGAFYPLVLSDRFKMVHSGDIKVYADVREPEWVTTPARCRIAATEAEALAWMKDSAFDPTNTLILVGSEAETVSNQCVDVDGTVGVTAAVGHVRYRPGAVTVDVETAGPIFLLLKEAWYPGWRAVLRATSGDEIRDAPVVRADLLMMAIPVPAGQWRIELSYQPKVVGWGLAVSIVGWLGILSYALVRRGRWRGETVVRR